MGRNLGRSLLSVVAVAGLAMADEPKYIIDLPLFSSLVWEPILGFNGATHWDSLVANLLRCARPHAPPRLSPKTCNISPRATVLSPPARFSHASVRKME